MGATIRKWSKVMAADCADICRCSESSSGEMFGFCRTPTPAGYMGISCWHLPEYHDATFLGRMERTGCLGCLKDLCYLAVRRALAAA